MPLYVGPRLTLLYPPVVASAPALGTPTYVNHATAGNGGGAGVMTINVPAGAVDNDILHAAISVNATSTITDPSGWTFLQQTSDGSNYRLRTYWRRASSEPASYQWTFTPSSGFSGIIVAYRDCLATGSPIDGTPTSNTGGTNTTAMATGLTTANDNEMLIMVASTAGSRNFTASTLTELFDGVPSGGVSFGYFHGLQAVAGASGNKNATLNSAAFWGAQLLAIKPSGGV